MKPVDTTITIEINRMEAIIEGSLNSNFRQYGELKSSDEKQMR